MALPFDEEALQRLLSGTVPAESAPVVDPAVRDYVAAMPDRSRDPTTRDQLSAALAADRKGQREADTASLIMQAGQSYANQRQAPREQRNVDDRMKEFILGRQAETQDETRAAAQEKAAFDRAMGVAGLDLKGREIEAARARAAEARAAREAETIADREFRASESERDRANRLEAASIAAQQKVAEGDAKKAGADEKRGDDLFVAADFEPTPEARPLEGAVRTGLFNKAANGSTMISSARKLRELIAKNRGGQITGPVASAMEGLATDLIMGGKEIYGLGVLNPNDEVILGRIIKNPTQIASIAADESGVRSLDAIYRTLEDVMRRRVVLAFAQAGHKPKPGTLFAEPDGGADKVKVRDPQSGKVLRIPRSQLQAALADGAQVVE